MSISSRENAHASLLQRRGELLNKLSNINLRHPAETSSFGNHNPFHVALAECECCGRTPSGPQESRATRNRTLWTVNCVCGALSGDGQREPWIASLLWNAKNLGSQRYQDLPLFDLAALDQAAAKARIGMIRESLTLRIRLCSLDSSIAAVDRTHPRPGQQYRLRLDAYLKWAMLASRLIKIAPSHQRTE